MLLRNSLSCCIGLALLTFALAAPGPTQDLRYELGARLRLFERDFEHCSTPAERAKALNHLMGSVQYFFGLNMLSAVQELDAARVAIQPDNTRSVLNRASNIRLTLKTRIIEDPSAQNLEGTLSALYGEQDWSQLVWHWQIELSGTAKERVPVQQHSSLLDGEVKIPDSGDGKLHIPVDSLIDGDYKLKLLVRDQSAAWQEVSPIGSGIVALETMFSITCKARARLDQISQQIASISPELDATQLSTLKHNTKTVRKVLEGATLETDFPVNRILCQSEKAVQLLLDGKQAYGNGDSGEFWLETSTPSGQKWLRLLAPDAVSQKKPLPLVVALHGAGGSENMFFDTYGDGKVVKLAQERQWLLVAPRLAFGGLNLDDLIDSIDQLYPVDRESIFLVGHSMGASAAVSMTQNSISKPTAVAALGGGRPISDPEPFQSVGLWVAAGSHDFGRSGARKLADSFETCMLPCQYREYENVEHLAIVQAALDDVFQFFDQCVTLPLPNEAGQD